MRECAKGAYYVCWYYTAVPCIVVQVYTLYGQVQVTQRAHAVTYTCRDLSIKYLEVHTSKHIRLLRSIVERRSVLHTLDNVIDLVGRPCVAFEKVLGSCLRIVQMLLILRCRVPRRRPEISE